MCTTKPYTTGYFDSVMRNSPSVKREPLPLSFRAFRPSTAAPKDTLYAFWDTQEILIMVLLGGEAIGNCTRRAQRPSGLISGF